MARNSRRIHLAAVYVLHHRPWRDTSRMLDVFSREYGRLTLFARGVRGSKSQSASLLQPFQPLVVSWIGGGDTAQLTHVEAAPGLSGCTVPLPPAALLSAWYLNELLLKLTERGDPQSAVFDLYHLTLDQLRCGAVIAPVLRAFERHLLELIGYAVQFSQEARHGEPLKVEAHYHFHPNLGFVEISGTQPTEGFSGRSLLAIAADNLMTPEALEDARKIMRIAIDHALEGRELRTRVVARAITRAASTRAAS